ncbi:hypothetical protein [Nocardioides sp. YIM 152588]|uniref:alpha/beta hydrolase family protein n=1 Tax=Nocardioides sp. YIM 152588 TaxID=3158259 RepID=UPI0032E4E302
MHTMTVSDGAEAFDVTVLGDPRSSRTVLFSVGSGGDPGRHLPLLTALAEGGLVVAPHFERLATPRPSADQLTLRARRLSLAVEAVGAEDGPVAGIGHSIGATVLLALAGARMWLGPATSLDVVPIQRLRRVALLAPAAGYFLAPGAVDAVRAPVLAWIGSEDPVTPPSQLELLADGLRDLTEVDLRVAAGGGHFSFLHEPPPGVPEPLGDREAFLAEMCADLVRFVSEN